MSYSTEYITYYMTMHHSTFPYLIFIVFWWNWIAFQLSKMVISHFSKDFGLDNNMFHRKKREKHQSVVGEMLRAEKLTLNG